MPQSIHAIPVDIAEFVELVDYLSFGNPAQKDKELVRAEKIYDVNDQFVFGSISVSSDMNLYFKRIRSNFERETARNFYEAFEVLDLLAFPNKKRRYQYQQLFQRSGLDSGITLLLPKEVEQCTVLLTSVLAEIKMTKFYNTINHAEDSLRNYEDFVSKVEFWRDTCLSTMYQKKGLFIYIL
ncbi:hypothetical protein EON83_05230 [bacterium]|nr:MAG: hypothetical protein EON83_05230 [bacterium]